MRRVASSASIGLVVLGLVLGAVGAQGSDPGTTFLQFCKPAPVCRAGKLSVASSTDDSGSVGLSVGFEAPVDRKGRPHPINFDAPSWMTCQYTDVDGVWHGYQSGQTIKKATSVDCYWSGEQLPS
jgi:hypothetical protein